LNFLWRPQTRDAGDEMVIEAAVNGQANAIITQNFRDLAAAAVRFGIALLSPQDALKRWFL
jgi:predicted nucleic acid-binding protein